MTDRKLNFTKAALSGISAPAVRTYYYDTKVSGLAIGVAPTGTKTFVLIRKIQRKPVRHKIGRFPDLTVEQARSKAAELNGRIALGQDPADERRLRAAEMTFRDLFNEYYKRHALPFKRTAKEDLAKFDRYLSKRSDHGMNLAGMRISEIDRLTLSELVARVGKNTQVTSNRVLALVSSVYGRAIEWGLWTEGNPARGVRRHRENSRSRFLHPREIGPFFAAVNSCPEETTRDFILTSLFTGARRGNVLAMIWEQINFQNAEWIIPRTKNGTPQTVPLVKQALELLARRKLASTSAYVFPGIGESGHLTEPKKAWKSILRNAGMEGFRLHDLRRSMGSWQAGTNANMAIIGRSLNHRSTATTAVYARLWDEPVRDAMSVAVDEMVLRASQSASVAKSHAPL